MGENPDMVYSASLYTALIAQLLPKIVASSDKDVYSTGDLTSVIRMFICSSDSTPEIFLLRYTVKSVYVQSSLFKLSVNSFSYVVYNGGWEKISAG